MPACRSSFAIRISLVIALTLAGTARAGEPVQSLVEQKRVEEVQAFVMANHVIMVDSEGQPLDPRTLEHFPNVPNSRRETPFQRHLNRITDGLGAAARNVPEGRTLRVIIFVHGGLNSYEGARDRAVDLGRTLVDFRQVENPDARQRRLLEDPHSDYYPLFVIWTSNLKQSLASHTLRVRDGQRVSLGRGMLGAPFVTATTLGRGVANYPHVWFKQALKFLRFGSPEMHSSVGLYEELCHIREDDPEAVRLYWPHRERRSFDALVGRAALTARTGITGLAVSPIVSEFGRAAWDNMRRNALNSFHTPMERQLPREVDRTLVEERMDYPVDGNGTLAVFFSQLAESLETLPNSSRLEVSLVGHSMGTIVINEAFLSSLKEKRVVDNVVYLAAACSLRDFELSVIPYLEFSRSTEFYNLTLAPQNEYDEMNFADLPHRGSLLDWIDAFYSSPATFDERRLGKFENSLHFLHRVPVDVRGRVSMKAFGIGRLPESREDYGAALDNPGPQRHGDFSDFDFWDPRFWKAVGPPEYPPIPATQDPRVSSGLEVASFDGEPRPFATLGMAWVRDHQFALGLEAKSSLWKRAGGNGGGQRNDAPISAFVLGLDLDFMQGALSSKTQFGYAFAWQDDFGTRDEFFHVEPSLSVVPYSLGAFAVTVGVGYRLSWDTRDDLGVGDMDGWTQRIGIRWIP